VKRQNLRKASALISFLLFPVTINFFSPYLIIDGAAKGIITGSFIVFLILFIGSLFTGRIFCSWVCPAGALQDYCVGVNSKKVRSRIVNKIKYIIWVPWITAIAATAVFVGGLKQIDFFYLTESGISVDEPLKYVIYFSVIAIFLILAFTLGKRGACHSICWMAPFMVVGSKIGRFLKIPTLHLKVENSMCTGCKTCEAKCPMSLEVNSMVISGSMVNSECILCGECIDTCPRKVISYTFGNKRPELKS